MAFQIVAQLTLIGGNPHCFDCDEVDLRCAYQRLVLLLISLSIPFLFTALAIGLLISTKAQSQMQALQLAWLIILPSVLLSGFMFPRDSMPVVMQIVGYLVPATHFMEIIRGIVLRGATLADLLPEVVTLVAMGVVLLMLSAFRFRKKLV